MKRNSIKSLILVVAFSLALFAGANQTFAKTKENHENTVKKMVVTTPETKLKGGDNAKAHGGKANAYGTAKDKLTGTENAKAHGGHAYAGEKKVEEAEEVEAVSTAVEEVSPVLKDIKNTKSKGGKAKAYGKSENKLTGVENARAHGGNAYACADDEAEVVNEVVVKDTAIILAEVVVAEVEPIVETPELTGIENARSHGGNAHAYGHSKKIEVLNLVL